MSTARFVLWVAPVFLQAWLAVTIWRRKLYRELPLFFVYVVLHVLRTSVFLMMDTKSWAYFYAFHAANVVDTVLELSIIYALFQRLVEPYHSVRKVGNVFFWLAASIAFVLACVNASSGVNESTVIMMVSLGMERGVHLIETALLLLMFSFAIILHLSWRSYLLGLAIGFCLLLTGQFVLFTARLRFGTTAHPVFDLLNAAAYNLTVIVWLVYALQAKAVNVVARPIAIDPIRQWDEAFSEYLHL